MIRYLELRQGFANACNQGPCVSGRINVWAKQLISTELAIAAMRTPHNSHVEITHRVRA